MEDQIDAVVVRHRNACTETSDGSYGPRVRKAEFFFTLADVHLKVCLSAIILYNPTAIHRSTVSKHSHHSGDTRQLLTADNSHRNGSIGASGELQSPLTRKRVLTIESSSHRGCSGGA